MAIRVTNRNAFDYKDRFDGLDFEFPAGKSIVIEEEPALVHIFGLGLETKDRLEKMSRAGWLKFHDEKGLREAWAIYNNFVFVQLEPNWKEQSDRPSTLHLTKTENRA
jgi:hypothetical protein